MNAEPEIIPPQPQAKRPVDFTDEIFDVICDRMTEGEGLREICKSPDMPSKTTFLRWVDKDTGRQRRYQAAREALMDHYAEEIIAIAWDDSQDTIKREGKPDLCNHEWINRSRLKVDTLKFLMAKLHPKKYGDKLPEHIEDRNFQITWEDATNRPRTIERVIIDPIHDDDGGIISQNDSSALADRIRVLEGRLAKATGQQPAGPPKQLTFDPGPLPSRMDGEIVTRLVDLIKANVPKADQRDPLMVLDEVMNLIGTTLGEHYSNSSSNRFQPPSDCLPTA